MKIYYEFLLWIIIPILFFITLKIFLAIGKIIARKKYKPEDDKAKKGGFARSFERGSQQLETTTSVDDGLEQPQGRELLQTTTSSPSRKNSKGVGRILKRRRRK